MGFLAGQFAGVGDAQLPGADRYPFLNTGPAGAYTLSVLGMRGFETRDGGQAFACDLDVIEGPEGAAKKVCFFTKNSSYYYLRDIKVLANALTGGQFEPDDIDESLIEGLFGNPDAPCTCGSEDTCLQHPTTGCVIDADVYDKPRQDGGTIRVHTFRPHDPEA